ncbi:uncharacterized protein LOC134527503 isoform X2 [Bacillus rossius redtenbacheri]|uniref:uncharacterized protein LOC134527503 isoform X2 n=1 Tax=Bacillus rossius redtenbacheri TaxID=93214 RepID=UPI002FDCF7BF
MRHPRASPRVHLDTSVCSPYGDTLQDRLSVCSRMSSHYRRLYNSRPVVDTSPPCSWGLLRGGVGRWQQTLVDAVVYDSRNSPSTYRCACDGRKHTSAARPLPQVLPPHGPRKPRQSYDIMKRHSHCFMVPRKAFQPRILKSEAESKAEEGDYSRDEWEPDDVEELRSAEEGKVRSHSSQSDAKASSCDSAYSGGVSSDQESGALPSHQRQDDVHYVKFVHDITEDVLRRGVFSNKGLQLLFQQHISNNESHLDKDRMETEVRKLSEDLGMCEEVVSSFGNLNLMVLDGSAGGFLQGNNHRVELLQTGMKGSLHNNTARDEFLCHNSGACPSVVTDPEKLSPQEMAAGVGSQKFSSEVVASACKRCSCEQDLDKQRFWTSISSRNSAQPAANTSDNDSL